MSEEIPFQSASPLESRPIERNIIEVAVRMAEITDTCEACGNRLRKDGEVLSAYRCPSCGMTYIEAKERLHE